MPISDETYEKYIKALDYAQAFQIIYEMDVPELNKLLTRMHNMFFGKDDVDVSIYADKIMKLVNDKRKERGSEPGTASHDEYNMKKFMMTRHIVTDSFEDMKKRKEGRKRYIERRRARIKAEKAERQDNVCCQCGKSFKAQRIDSKFCGAACRQAAYRERKKA